MGTAHIICFLQHICNSAQVMSGNVLNALVLKSSLCYFTKIVILEKLFQRCQRSNFLRFVSKNHSLKWRRLLPERIGIERKSTLSNWSSAAESSNLLHIPFEEDTVEGNPTKNSSNINHDSFS